MDRPSLKQIYDQIKGEMPHSLLPVSFNNIIASSLSGALHMLYGYAEAKARRMLPNSEDPKILEKWANLLGLQRTPASYATLKINLISSQDVSISKGTEFASNDGLMFRSLVEAKSNEPIQAKCSTPGPISIESVSLSQPIPHIDAQAESFEIVLNGFDQETDESLRRRVETRLRYPPQGGSVSDYVQWLLAESGVTQAWVLPRYGEQATVKIGFLIGKHLPTDQQRESIQERIQAKCPATALIQCPELETSPINIRLRLPSIDDNQKETIRNELDFMIIRLAKPSGYWDKDLNVCDGNIHESNFHKALAVLGIQDYEIESINGNQPTGIGKLCTLGRVEYVTS